MAQTDVEAPDGSIISVEHPEGASEQDIMLFAQQEFQNRQFSDLLTTPEQESVAAAPQVDFSSGRFSGITQDTPQAPQGGTIVDALGQGALLGFSDEIAGGLGATIGAFDPNLEGTTFGERFRGIRDLARQNAKEFAERNPNTALAAEIAGGVATGGVGAARAGAFQAVKNAPTIVSRLAPIAATGAVQGGLFGAGVSEAEDLQGVAIDAAKGAALGGATAPIVPALASGIKAGTSRVAQVATDSPAFQNAVKVLKDKVGLTRLTTGQATGSRPLRQVEGTLADTFFGGPIASRLERNRQQLQSKLMRMAGFHADDIRTGELTEEALENAANKFSKKYNTILGGRVVNLADDQFLDDLARIEAKHSELLPFEQKRIVTQVIDNFLDQATDAPLTGKSYQRLRSTLATRESGSSNNPALKSLFRDLKSALDDGFATQGGVGRAKTTLDRQYSRFATLRDTFRSSGSIETSRGSIPLSAALRRAQGKRGTDKDFREIIRAGQIVLGDPVPNSGTVPRLINAIALGGQGGSFATGGLDAGLLSVGLPAGGSLALSRGLTGGPSAQRAIQSGLLTAPVTTPIFGDFQ